MLIVTPFRLLEGKGSIAGRGDRVIRRLLMSAVETAETIEMIRFGILGMGEERQSVCRT